MAGRRGPRLRTPRYKLPDAVVALPGARALVAGDGAAPELLLVDRGRSVGLRGRLRAAWAFATATRRPGGRVLLAGGYDADIRPTDATAILTPPA